MALYHSYLHKLKSYKYILTVLNLLQSNFYPTETGLVKVTNGSPVAKPNGQLTISSLHDHPKAASGPVTCSLFLAMLSSFAELRLGGEN